MEAFEVEEMSPGVETRESQRSGPLAFLNGHLTVTLNENILLRAKKSQLVSKS